ncbi:MAG TPA: HupE/UreJ family protein [Xanthobacteraceae bacterium]|nr:HupE/UreJ family protein [Xanthobacteraceae bacterium]
MLRRFLFALLGLSVTSPALAHTGIGDTSGFLHGFLHPVAGVDHVLPMVAVGLFAAMLGGRALLLVPFTFVAMMAVGGALGMAGLSLPWTELFISLSVVTLGAVVAFRLKLPVAVAAALVGFFAIFHGHAHGAEMPGDASGFAYGAGFMLATATLHACGIVTALMLGMLTERNSRWITQLGGGAMALAGIAIVLVAIR